METTNYIDEAIEVSIARMLTLSEFIRHMSYPIEMSRIYSFHNTMRGGMPMYVDFVLVKRLGYTGVTCEELWEAFLYDLYAYKLNVDFYCITIEQYKSFLEALTYDVRLRYPTPTDVASYCDVPIINRRTNTVSSTYHVLLEPHCFDKFMTNSKNIDLYKHYCAAKELFAVYHTYTAVYEARKKAESIDDWEVLDHNEEDTSVNTHLYPAATYGHEYYTTITPRPSAASALVRFDDLRRTRIPVAPPPSHIDWKRPGSVLAHYNATHQLLESLPNDLSGSSAAELFATQYLRAFDA